MNKQINKLTPFFINRLKYNFASKDGVTVAKAIEFSDRFANMGASLIKSVADKTNDQAGDGTTTATILARAIFREALKKVETGINLSEMKKGIDLAVETIVK